MEIRDYKHIIKHTMWKASEAFIQIYSKLYSYDESIGIIRKPPPLVTLS